MPSRTEDEEQGPIQKLKSTFREIFGKPDTPTLKTDAPDEKTPRNDNEKIS